MTQQSGLSRRRFLLATGAAVASTPVLSFAKRGSDFSLQRRLFKTLKIGMVRVKGPLTGKFKAAKAAGFDGIEMNSPGMNVAETKEAIAESGLPVDGTVCSSHWSIRHTDPNPETRAKALEHLQQAIRDTHAVGGHTALLVIGHGKDGTEKEIWKRSIDNIQLALPLAAELGIHIAIENVWNHFLYDHQGGPDQNADKFVKYVDELNSPWVGMQFDIGNHWKYGNTGDWIRALGKRIVKLDAKGFSRKKGNFIGWCAAEVGGGGPDRLKEVVANMNRVFLLE